MGNELKCPTCGAWFTPRASGGKPQKHCSRRCTDKAAKDHAVARRMAARPVQCAECGSQFTQPTTGRPRRYCSEQCKQRVSNRAQNRRRLPAPKAAARICERCGSSFDPRRRDQVYCGARCRINAGQARRYRNEPLRQGVEFDRQCVECGMMFRAAKSNAKWCSNICRIRTCRRDESRRRAPGAGASLYADREIFERDNWVCQICRQPVGPTVDRRQPDGATIDHVIPLSKGGKDEPDNVVTAHWRCNRDKGNRT